MKNFEDISIYFLILELLNDGRAGFYPHLEPLSRDDIFASLELRTGVVLSRNDDVWAKWFLASETAGSEQDRANLLIFLKTQSHMRKLYSQRNVTE